MNSKEGCEKAAQLHILSVAGVLLVNTPAGDKRAQTMKHFQQLFNDIMDRKVGREEFIRRMQDAIK